MAHTMQISCTLMFLYLVKKKKCSSVQTCWFCSPSRANILMLSPPHFSWLKRTKHVIKTTKNVAYELIFIFHINFQTCPSTEFQPWTTLHLTPHTLYKSFMTWFHTHMPLRRENLDLHYWSLQAFFSIGSSSLFISPAPLLLFEDYKSLLVGFLKLKQA